MSQSRRRSGHHRAFARDRCPFPPRRPRLRDTARRTPPLSVARATQSGHTAAALPVPVTIATYSGRSTARAARSRRQSRQGDAVGTHRGGAARSRHYRDVFGTQHSSRRPFPPPSRRSRDTPRRRCPFPSLSRRIRDAAQLAPPVPAAVAPPWRRVRDTARRRCPFLSLWRRVRDAAELAPPVPVTIATRSGRSTAGAAHLRRQGDVVGIQHERRRPSPSPGRRSRDTARAAPPISVARAT
jgi:hypothetical protein